MYFLIKRCLWCKLPMLSIPLRADTKVYSLSFQPCSAHYFDSQRPRFLSQELGDKTRVKNTTISDLPLTSGGKRTLTGCQCCSASAWWVSNVAKGLPTGINRPIRDQLVNIALPQSQKFPQNLERCESLYQGHNFHWEMHNSLSSKAPNL